MLNIVKYIIILSDKSNHSSLRPFIMTAGSVVFESGVVPHWTQTHDVTQINYQNTTELYRHIRLYKHIKPTAYATGTHLHVHSGVPIYSLDDCCYDP
jgi:hypothetical protein